MEEKIRRTALDLLCTLVAESCAAKTVCLIVSEKKNGGRIVASVGCNAVSLSGSVEVPKINRDTLPVFHFKNLSREPWFKSHALSSIDAHAKSLVIIALPLSSRNLSYIAAFSPNNGGNIDIANLSKLATLAALISEKVDDAIPEEKKIGDAVSYGLQETAEAFEGTKASIGEDAILAFLARTLPKQPVLKSKNGVTYTVIRRWKSQLKETQIAAIQALKVSTNSVAAELAAAEIVETMQNVFPGLAFDFIVPIPCGSSGMARCLSVQIAERISSHLNIPLNNCLSNNTAVGTSHPKKSIKLKPYAVNAAVHGKVLLVDDIVTTGTHLLKANHALRDAGVATFSIGWIGS